MMSRYEDHLGSRWTDSAASPLRWTPSRNLRTGVFCGASICGGSVIGPDCVRAGDPTLPEDPEAVEQREFLAQVDAPALGLSLIRLVLRVVVEHVLEQHTSP